MEYPNATLDQVSTPAGGSIPAGIPTGFLYTDKNDNKKRIRCEKTESPCASMVWDRYRSVRSVLVHTKLMIDKRRRAQNRASQAAFRKRQQQRMKDLERNLSELEQKHHVLSRSYESLQLECSIVKQELETFHGTNNDRKSTSPGRTLYGGIERPQMKTLNLFLLDSEELNYGAP
jgi:hypothetical protein